MCLRVPISHRTIVDYWHDGSTRVTNSPTETTITFTDDDLTHLQAHGVPALPEGQTGTVDNDGARIWYTRFGKGPEVILLHGGLGTATNFAYQLPALVAAGYAVTAIDSRGQGHSTRDGKRYSYELMAADTRAVMDKLGIAKAVIVGWS